MGSECHKNYRVALFTAVFTTTAVFMFLFYGVTPKQNSQDENVLKSELNMRDFVECFDKLRLAKEQKCAKKMLPNRTLHFAFIGDSRVRQFYYSFLQVLPDYDREKATVPDVAFHEDRFVYSHLLGLFVSFQWRPTLLKSSLKNVTNTFNAWINYEAVEMHDREMVSPDIFFLGMGLHHMLDLYGADYMLYEQQLRILKRVLEKFTAKRSRVVWLNQYPTIDWRQPTLLDIYTEKITRYNNIAQAVLGGSGVEIWHDPDPLVTEYIRSCGMNEKTDKVSVTPEFFFGCRDRIHTGEAVLGDSIRLLFANVCKSLD